MKPTRYYFLTYFKRVPSAWLLIVQLCILISLPLYNNSFEEQAMSWLLGTLALIMVALVIRNSPIFTKTGMTLVVLAMTLSIWAVLSGREDLLAYAHICEAFVYFYGAAAMVMYMFDDHEVTRDQLFATAAVFTLLVWGFAFLYSVCQQWYPGSFTASVDSDA